MSEENEPTYAEWIDAAVLKLLVRRPLGTDPDPADLVVDAKALMTEGDVVRCWELLECTPGDPGVWIHTETGIPGTLMEVLRGVASCYHPSIPRMPEIIERIEAREAERNATEVSS